MSAYPLWDIPTRLFHWLLVSGLALAWFSHEQDWYEVHRWAGYAMVVLVSFRMLWGVWGSRHSRFVDFVRSPRAVLRYWRGQGDAVVGHNPAGGWSVLALLLLVLTQGVTGLFNSDDLFFDGPLHFALDSDVADRLGALHDQLFWIIVGFSVVHVLAVAWYQFVLGKPLLQPMVSGGSTGAEPPASILRALALLALCAGLLALAIALAPEPVSPW